MLYFPQKIDQKYAWFDNLSSSSSSSSFFTSLQSLASLLLPKCPSDYKCSPWPSAGEWSNRVSGFVSLSPPPPLHTYTRVKEGNSLCRFHFVCSLFMCVYLCVCVYAYVLTNFLFSSMKRKSLIIGFVLANYLYNKEHSSQEILRYKKFLNKQHSLT